MELLHQTRPGTTPINPCRPVPACAAQPQNDGSVQSGKVRVDTTGWALPKVSDCSSLLQLNLFRGSRALIGPNFVQSQCKSRIAFAWSHLEQCVEFGEFDTTDENWNYFVLKHEFVPIRLFVLIALTNDCTVRSVAHCWLIFRSSAGKYQISRSLHPLLFFFHSFFNRVSKETGKKFHHIIHSKFFF